MEQTTSKTALLVMDMQAGLLAGFSGSERLIANNKKAIDYARQNNIPVIFVSVGFRPTFVEISGTNKGFSAAKDRFASVDMNAFIRIHPDLGRRDDETWVIKRRVSAFTGSDLEVVLRSGNICHIVLTGIATSGVVLSTLREASDKDYEITVLADCCGDGDEEVQHVLTTKVFPRQAEVINVDEWRL